MTQQNDYELGEKVAQAIDRANRAEREKAEAAEAEQAKERAEATARNEARIIEFSPDLDEWELTATASGVWIVLPDCLPIRIHMTDSKHVAYEPATRECLESRHNFAPNNPHSWMRCFNLDEAIQKAYEGAEREEREAENAKMRQEAQEKEWAKYETPAKTADERIADALEKIAGCLGPQIMPLTGIIGSAMDRAAYDGSIAASINEAIKRGPPSW